MDPHGIFITAKEVTAFWRGTLIASLDRRACDPSEMMLWSRSLIETLTVLGTPSEVIEFVL
jgi:hypothetical protein